MSKIQKVHVVRGAWTNDEGKTFGVRIGSGRTSLFIPNSDLVRVATELADMHQAAVDQERAWKEGRA